jgi:hypothetical protein
MFTLTTVRLECTIFKTKGQSTVVNVTVTIWIHVVVGIISDLANCTLKVISTLADAII